MRRGGDYGGQGEDQPHVHHQYQHPKQHLGGQGEDQPHVHHQSQHLK